MALIVLDASIVIALLDAGDALHSRATDALDRLAAEDLRVPASAYSESLVGPARRGHLHAARTTIESLLLEVVPVTDRIAEAAASLRARHPRLRLPDALVVATGAVLAADVVLTGDAGWQRLGRPVQVLG